MHILTNGTPLTNGEVYALIRRRRDERSSEIHPPFGLQHVQADTQSRASSHYGPAGRLLSAYANGSDVNSASSIEASRILLSSPSSAHLIVLLTEVRLLNYLGNHACLKSSKDGALRNIYGPSTVYAQQEQHGFTMVRTGFENKGDDLETQLGEKCRVKASGAPVSSKCNINDGKSAGTDACEPRYGTNPNDSTNIKDWQEVILQNRAGTPVHINAVQHLLTYYENQGYQKEKNWAYEIRNYVETLRFSNLHKTVKPEPSDTNEESCNALGEFPLSLSISSAVAARPVNSVNVRPLLSAPKNLHMNSDVADAASCLKQSYPSSNSMYHKGIVVERLFLTQQELMQLIVGRPRSNLEVYRLLDNLSERFGSDEEAALRFINFITNVFETSNEDKVVKEEMKGFDDT